MIKVTQDGAFVGYIEASATAAGNYAIDDGNYILGDAQKVADSSETAVTAGAGHTFSAGDLAANSTDVDVAFTTAYQVNIDVLGTGSTVRLKGVSGAAGAVTDDDWVKKNTVLVVTGTTIGNDLVHQLIATDDAGAHNVGAAAVVATTDTVAVSGEFTVSNGDVTFSETSGYTVKVPGKQVVLAAGEKVRFEAVNENAVYAAKKNVTDGHASTLTQVAITSVFDTDREYTVNANDATAGVIELVQVAKVTITGLGTSSYKKVGETGASTGNITSTEYYEIGAELSIVGPEAATATNGQVILVKNASGTAVKADGTATGVAEAGDGPTGTPASAKYVIKNTDYDLVFTKGADPT